MSTPGRACHPLRRSSRGGWTLLILVATGVGWPGMALTQTVNSEQLAVEAYVVRLQAPTGMVFLADDDLLVIEKNTGRVRRARNGLLGATVLDIRVSTAGERGGLGIELSPDFDEDGFVYIYYSAAVDGDNTGWTENVVARYRWNGSRLVSPAVLLTFPSRSGQPNGPNHDGGTLRFGPDGNLYGQVGDLNRGRFDDPRIEQNTGGEASAEVGGIFRIDGEGNVPTTPLPPTPSKRCASGSCTACATASASRSTSSPVGSGSRKTAPKSTTRSTLGNRA